MTMMYLHFLACVLLLFFFSFMYLLCKSFCAACVWHVSEVRFKDSLCYTLNLVQKPHNSLRARTHNRIESYRQTHSDTLQLNVCIMSAAGLFDKQLRYYRIHAIATGSQKTPLRATPANYTNMQRLHHFERYTYLCKFTVVLVLHWKSHKISYTINISIMSYDYQ